MTNTERAPRFPAFFVESTGCGRAVQEGLPKSTRAACFVSGGATVTGAAFGGVGHSQKKDQHTHRHPS